MDHTLTPIHIKLAAALAALECVLASCLLGLDTKHSGGTGKRR